MFPHDRPISTYFSTTITTTAIHSNLHAQFLRYYIISSPSLSYHDSSYPVVLANLHSIVLFLCKCHRCRPYIYVSGVTRGETFRLRDRCLYDIHHFFDFPSSFCRCYKPPAKVWVRKYIPKYIFNHIRKNSIFV